MKRKNQGHEFDEVAKKLCSPDARYILWGAANIGKNILRLCGNEINIVGVVDSSVEKQGTYMGGHMIGTPDALRFDDDCIVIVSTSAFKQVSAKLREKGYVENVNFFDYFVFLQIFLLYRRGELYSRRLDISLTEKCTLKCRKCNMFMPYFSKPRELEKETVIQEVDNYFKLVDYVEGFNLLGGEPFLYKSLADVVEYVGKKYRDRMEHFAIFTNGMILPTERELELFQRYLVKIQISDYSARVPYSKRIEELVRILEEKGISYVIMKSERWGDFGFPENPNTISEDELIGFFDRCRAPFRGLYKNRVYFCHLETSAIRAGLYEDNENDYFDLDQKDDNPKKKFLEFDFGYLDEGAVSFCRKCRGCDCVNSLTVVAAEQMREKNVYSE